MTQPKKKICETQNQQLRNVWCRYEVSPVAGRSQRRTQCANPPHGGRDEQHQRGAAPPPETKRRPAPQGANREPSQRRRARAPRPKRRPPHLVYAWGWVICQLCEIRIWVGKVISQGAPLLSVLCKRTPPHIVVQEDTLRNAKKVLQLPLPPPSVKPAWMLDQAAGLERPPPRQRSCPQSRLQNSFRHPS